MAEEQEYSCTSLITQVTSLLLVFGNVARQLKH